MSSKYKTPSSPPAIDGRAQDAASSSRRLPKRRDVSEGQGQKSPLKKANVTPPPNYLEPEAGGSRDPWEPPLSDERFVQGFKLLTGKEDLDDDPLNIARIEGKEWREMIERMIHARMEKPKRWSTGEKEFYGGYEHVSDDAVKRRIWNNAIPGSGDLKDWYWPDLRLRISQFVGWCLHWKVSLNEIDDNTAAKARALSPEADSFFKSGRFAASFFESWVWHILCDNLFSPDSDKWQPGPWETFAAMQNNLKGSVSRFENNFNLTFHNTRYAIARMHLMLHGEHTSTERLVAIIKRELRPFIRNEDDENTASSISVNDRILDLAKAAILVDRFIVCNTTDICITMQDPKTKTSHGFLPDKNTEIMKVEGDVIGPWEDEKDFPVQIVYEPLVEAFGLAKQTGSVESLSACVWREPMLVGRKLFVSSQFDSREAYNRHHKKLRLEWEAKTGVKKQVDEEKGEWVDKEMTDDEDDEDDEDDDYEDKEHKEQSNKEKRHKKQDSKGKQQHARHEKQDNKEKDKESKCSKAQHAKQQSRMKEGDTQMGGKHDGTRGERRSERIEGQRQR